MRGSFASNVVHTMGTSIVVAILGVAASAVLARSLGPEGRGAYAIAVQAMLVLVAFGQFGVPETMMAQMRSERRRLDLIAGNSALLVVIATALVGGVLWAGYPLLRDSLFEDTGQRLIVLSFLLVPLNLTFVFFSRILQLSGLVRIYNGLLALQAIGGLSLLLIWLLVWDTETEAAVLGLVTAVAITGLTAAVLVNREMPFWRWRLSGTLGIESLRGGIKLQFGMVAALLGQQLGVFVLAIYVDLRSAGLYAAALAVTNFLLMFSQSARTVLQAWMPGESIQPDMVKQRTILVTRHTAIILGAGGLILAILGYPLIKLLFGADFTPAYGPMLILLVAALWRGLGQVTVSYLVFEGRLGLAAISAPAGLAVNVLLALLLAPSIGIYGVAIAALVGQFATLLFLVGCFSILAGSKWTDLWPRWKDVQSYSQVVRRLRPSQTNKPA